MRVDRVSELARQFAVASLGRVDTPHTGIVKGFEGSMKRFAVNGSGFNGGWWWRSRQSDIWRA